MSTKTLFHSAVPSMPKGVEPVNTVNSAGGVAYALSDEAALAQYALTGCFNSTYYATDEEQMKRVLEFARKCDPEFVAKVAVYARERGYMKDMPSFLLAYLAATNTALMKAVFPRVVDSPKMIRNFVQMIRSGQLGRKSFGTAPKRLVTGYLNGLTDDQLFRADVGNDPSLQDIIKMVRPCPATKQRAALYGYLIDRDNGRFGDQAFVVAENLTELAAQYETFKKALASATSETEKNRLIPPDVPFLMLTALPLTKEHWKIIATRATWQQLRMNLNTFQRHSVFEDKDLTIRLAAKLADRNEIVRAKAFPYQLFAAYQYLGDDVPIQIRNATIDAADIAVSNVPKLEGHVVVCPDVSGSMSSPITGHRVGATSKMRCIDIAALVAAAVLRQNPEATILPFEQDIVTKLSLNSRDSVLTNAKALASIGGGGTNCSAPLRHLNAKRAKVDFVWFVSDNESWVDRPYSYFGGGSTTGTMGEFSLLKERNPSIRMACLDIQPNSTTQAHERQDILNAGGFSDTSFDVVANFARGSDARTLVDTIKAVRL